MLIPAGFKPSPLRGMVAGPRHVGCEKPRNGCRTEARWVGEPGPHLTSSSGSGRRFPASRFRDEKTSLQLCLQWPRRWLFASVEGSGSQGKQMVLLLAWGLLSSRQPLGNGEGERIGQALSRVYSFRPLDPLPAPGAYTNNAVGKVWALLDWGREGRSPGERGAEINMLPRQERSPPEPSGWNSWRILLLCAGTLESCSRKLISHRERGCSLEHPGLRESFLGA
ncbi:unnamed protein product [Natator depressus]